MIGGISLAGRWTKEPSRVMPRPATINAKTSVSCFGRRPVVRRSRVGLRVTILRPLPDIAGHVVETETVSRLQTHWVRLTTRIFFEPSMGSRSALVVTPPEPGGAARPCRILPFRFGGQAVWTVARGRAESLQLPIEPGSVGLSIVPANTDHGIVISLLKARIFPTRASVLG